MKKLFIVLIALLVLCGCSESKEEEVVEISGENEEINVSYGVANPWVECESVETLNKITGSNLFAPATMGITVESCSYMESASYTISEYKFSCAGYDYTFRTAHTEDDISGFYRDSGAIFNERTEDEIEYYEGTEVKAARWFNDYGQFCILCDDQGEMTEEQFTTIVEELKECSEISHTVSDCDLLAGSYYDATSQRAFADITSNGDSVTIDIYWATSAFELTRWTMTATFEGEDSLFYKNMQTSTITFDGEEDEEGTEVITANGGAGYFTVKDDGIYWDGSMDESTEQCIFVLDTEE